MFMSARFSDADSVGSEIGLERFWDTDAAIGLLVGLDQGHKQSRN
jgi:hypothetical protein